MTLSSQPWMTQQVQAQDCLVILAAHSAYDYPWLVRTARLIVDAVNATRCVPERAGNVVRLGAPSVCPLMIYLDNAATSWPKPPAVTAAMNDFLRARRRQPGTLWASAFYRSGAGRLRYTRAGSRAASACPTRCGVIFTPNVTTALNLALRGLVHPGDHVVTSSMEHNAVMRPLRALEHLGCKVDGGSLRR